MNPYESIRAFEEKLKAKYQQEFADEQRLATELLNLYLEAVHIISQQWQLKPERRPTLELITRIFNDLHAGWKLIMERMSVQGMALFRDTIECAHYIKLFEADEEFRDEWLEGKDFFLREIRGRMKKKGISPPPQDQFYRTLSQTFTHPSKKGTTSHVVEWYPMAQEHRVRFMYGGVEDIPRTRSAALAGLALTYVTVYFMWQEMFPIDKDVYPAWYGRFSGAPKQIYSLQAKADQEWMKFNLEQWATIQNILDDYLKGFFRF